MTQMSPVMLTEHSDRVALSVINLDVGVQLTEPSDIICLINVSHQIHEYSRVPPEWLGRVRENKYTSKKISSGVFTYAMHKFRILRIWSKDRFFFFKRQFNALQFVLQGYDAKGFIIKRLESKRI